jgi:exodeoxyribonuclease-3
MRVLTLNVNGIRSALKKGLAQWLETLNADLILLQEIRASSDSWNELSLLPAYDRIFNYAVQPGYSGVGILSRYPLQEVLLAHPCLSLHNEGRFIQARIGRMQIINLYCPSGSSSPERQLVKLQYLKELNEFGKTLSEHVLIAGDMNIAHTIDDIKNWKQNFYAPGCTPEERTWFTDFLKTYQLVDTFRVLHPEAKDVYTWWSNRGQAFAKNVGWRIDYQLTSQALAPLIKKAWVERDPKLSDHAGYLIDIDYQPDLPALTC